MELRQLQNFVKVAELENVTRAAAELHMAQPPLSRQVKALEAELGVPLFERERQRIHLTPEGRLFRQQCEQILGLVDKSVEQVREMRDGMGGTVFIGAIETAGTMLLPGWIAAFRAAHPAVRYNLWSGNSDDVIERLEHGLVDLALIREPFDAEKFDSLHVLDEEWVAMVRSDHPLATAGTGRLLSLKALANEPLIVPTRRTQEISRWFSDKGLKANILCEFAPLMNAVALVEASIGVAICPESAAHALGDRPIALRRLADCPHSSGVSLIWRRNRALPQVERRFVELVTNCI